MGRSPKTIFFGILKPAKVSLQNLIISSSVAFFCGDNSINAHGVSPHFSSGLATTADKDTEGCFEIVFSISIEEIFSPPEIIISFDLSCIFTYPSGCITAKSPEGYLFPDTYFFFSGDTPLFVLNKLISSNKKFWTKKHIDKAKKLKLTRLRM